MFLLYCVFPILKHSLKVSIVHAYVGIVVSEQWPEEILLEMSEHLPLRRSHWVSNRTPWFLDH